MMLWWKSRNQDTITIKDGKYPVPSTEKQALSDLKNIQKIIVETKMKLQDLEDYNFPTITRVLCEVGKVADYSFIARVHKIKPKNAEEIMQKIITNIYTGDNQDGFDVDQLCKEIKDFFNRNEKIKKLKTQIIDYENYEKNIKEFLGIK